MNSFRFANVIVITWMSLSRTLTKDILYITVTNVTLAMNYIHKKLVSVVYFDISI